jgi:hypothetical protein
MTARRRVVELLSWPDADVAQLAAVGFDEFLRLHEHAAGAAAGIVDAAFVGREHLDEEAHDALRGVELSAFLSLGAGKLAEEVFVNATENVFRATSLVAHANGPDEVDKFAEAVLIERRTGIFFREDTFQARVVALDRDHGVIDDLADLGLLCAVLEICPARARRNPEDVLGFVFILVFRIGPGFVKQRGVFLFECVGDVFQEDEAENDVLVFGRVHVAAQLIRSEPELRFEAEIGGGVFRAAGSSASHVCLGSRQISDAPILLGRHRGRVLVSGERRICQCNRIAACDQWLVTCEVRQDCGRIEAKGGGIVARI